MKSALHIGAIVDSHTPAAWVTQLLTTIDQHELMQLDVVIQAPSTATKTGSGRVDKFWIDDWLLHKVIDFPHFNHDPWKPDALPAAIAVTTLAHSQLADQMADQLSGQKTGDNVLDTCDVILNLTEFTVLPRSLVPVWSANLAVLSQRIKHCLLNDAPFIWIHLWNTQSQAVQSNKDKSLPERIASHSLPCQTYSISDLRRLTYSSLSGLFMSRLTWLANSAENRLDPIDMQALNQGVFDEDQRLAAEDAIAAINASIDKTVVQQIINTAKTLRVLTRKTYERLHHKLFSERWQMAVSYAPDSQPESLATICQLPVHSYNTVEAPTDAVWADPHLCEHNGDMYVFFERMQFHNENAHIAYARLNKEGKLIDTGVALSNDHHLSFPFVFNHENDMYMIPETASQSKISLYKATHFPDQWALEHVLIKNINAADTILLQHAERWWMFTNCQSHRSVDERDELHIFFADTLQGPWQPHALNPVITGVDRSRMAGPIIEEDGNLYRSSQYGAYRYGYGINISRIDELTPCTYKESASWRILPEKGAGWSGCHSFTRAGNLVMIDRVRFSRT